jgi:DTW domain-containing protein YfiP
MSRRNNLAHRCVRCRMHQSLCVCALIPRLVTRTRVLLVIHRSEDRKPTNTGRLATECLVNSEVVVRGHPSAQAEPLPIPEGTRPVLLYPAEDAVPLVDLAPKLGDRPVTLIVPDGNWRQAFKVRNRVPGLRDVACVTLPASETKPSVYRLRAEAHAHGLATIEAVARALGVLEGPEIEAALEFPFRAMVERTLWARGNLEAGDVTGGIPEGAHRHDPVSGVLAAARAR